MLCCSLRRARYSDAIGLFVATVGTLLALPLLPGAQRTPMSPEEGVAVAAPGCDRGFSSQASGQALVDGRVTPDPAFAAAVCRASGGEQCDLAGLVSLETALCAAEEQAFGEGQAAHAYLAHDADRGALVWKVEAARILGTCDRELAVLDARTGALLAITHQRDPFCGG